MSLLENAAAALLFTAVATASLGLWSLGLAAEQRRAAQQQSLERIEAHLAALELGLRQQAAALPHSDDCTAATQRLGALVSAAGGAEGLRRQLSLEPEAAGLWVTLAPVDAPAGEQALERRRWFSAAALGLCGGWGAGDGAL